MGDVEQEQTVASGALDEKNRAVDKSPDAFRTISEVAEDLDLPQHVLRFWETRFSQIKPLKRGGGRRYYRPDDVELLKGIRYLLYGEGYTIRGVQRILKEQGLKVVISLGRDDVSPSGKPALGMLPEEDERPIASPPPPVPHRGIEQQSVQRARPADPQGEYPVPPLPRSLPGETPRPEPRRGLFGIIPAILSPEDDSTPPMPRIVETPRAEPHRSLLPDESRPMPMPRSAFAPAERSEERQREPAPPVVESPVSFAPKPAAPVQEAAKTPAPVPVAPMPAAPASFSPRAPIMPLVEEGRLPAADINRLKATLFELVECRRLLDAAREVEQ